MPTYNFTSDLRITELRERIKSSAILIVENKLSQEDKSTQNNAATLAFYFNLQKGTETLRLASQGNITEVIRNMVLKFQFPNTYTRQLFEINVQEGTNIAPLRECIKILMYMHLMHESNIPYLTHEEILFYVFVDDRLNKIDKSFADYKSIIEDIKHNREVEFNYSQQIELSLVWSQYVRQSRELIKIITFASEAFTMKNGCLYFKYPDYTSENYADTMNFISSALVIESNWIPSSTADFESLKQDYIRYNDIKGEIFIEREPIHLPFPTLKSLNSAPIQQIFFGAPGTGKSHSINQVCRKYSHYRITFHPDTDYAAFVGSYKPITIEEPVYTNIGTVAHAVMDTETNRPLTTKKITYNYVIQPFLKAYIKAWKEQQNEIPQPVFLVIEEINRGNCAQIFGDIFQLLDRNESGYSNYPITTDSDLEKILANSFANLIVSNAEEINYIYDDDIISKVKDGSHLLLPNNLYIWATMNTSDQSLFPIDSAFKRRWDWKYIKIADCGMNYRIVVNGNEYDWWQFVEAINHEIETECAQEDKKLGYFFAKTTKEPDGKYIISANKFVGKVLFFLYNDVYKDYGYDNKIFMGENGNPMLFADYFDQYGNTVESAVERFLQNLGLKPISVSEVEESSKESEEEQENLSE